MSKTTIVGGSVTKTSVGKTYIEVTDGNFESYAATFNIWEGGELGVNEYDYTPTPKVKTAVIVTAAIFFDGTQNNRNNTRQRLNSETGIYEQVKDKKGSYGNYYSNIAIMEMMNNKDPKNRIVSVYIEGPGTEDNEKDNTMGSGFGAGKTGIPAKVQKGKDKIIEEVNKVFDPTEEYVKELVLDVFGFSRGAAAARNFITTQHAALKTKYNQAKITYRFVGLFDTVSSYEKEGRLGLAGAAASHNFDDDIPELQLRLGGKAQKIVHLTAADEYRKNFSLTNIDSSIVAGVGYEVQLPGAHSDIGGGYQEQMHREERIVSQSGTATNKARLVAAGWYTEAQLQQDMGKHDFNRFKGIRKLNNHYQYIPLAIMIQLAEKYGMTFHSFEIKKYKNHKVPSELQAVYQALSTYVLNHDSATKRTVKLAPEATLKWLRNTYLHLSAHHGLGMEARVEQSVLKRKIHRG